MNRDDCESCTRYHAELAALRVVAEQAERFLQANGEHECIAMGPAEDEEESGKDLYVALDHWRRNWAECVACMPGDGPPVEHTCAIRFREARL